MSAKGAGKRVIDKSKFKSCGLECPLHTIYGWTESTASEVESETAASTLR